MSEAGAILARVTSDLPDFQAYRGSAPPQFANEAELECAKILDYHGVPWLYEPRAFTLEEDEDGRVLEAFAPDFYLPEQNLFLEITVMKQSLVTRKNRKLRKLRERYPDVNIKLFYKRDVEALADEFEIFEAPRGAVLFNEGEPGDSLYIVLAGKVKLGRRSPDGRENLVAVYGPSDQFGELSLFDPGPRSATVTARSSSRQTEAISEPVNPAPMTSTRFGRAASSRCSPSAVWAIEGSASRITRYWFACP